MEWIVRIIFLLIGVVATALFYRRNRQKMDKVVDKAKETVKAEVKKIAGKVKRQSVMSMT